MAYRSLKRSWTCGCLLSSFRVRIASSRACLGLLVGLLLVWLVLQTTPSALAADSAGTLPTKTKVLPAPLPAQLSVKKDLPLEQQPFWRRRPALEKRIREERAVIVSVKREDLIEPKDFIRFSILGAGLVSRSKDVSFRLAQDYSKLKEVSDHFRTVNYDPGTRQLFLITEALGYQARMILKMTPVVADWRSELQWEVVWGHFKGMKGLMGFEKSADDRTEVSIQAVYESKELPLPKILMGFALEVITQKVAEKMRTFLETQAVPVLPELPSPLLSPALGHGGAPNAQPGSAGSPFDYSPIASPLLEPVGGAKK